MSNTPAGIGPPPGIAGPHGPGALTSGMVTDRGMMPPGTAPGYGAGSASFASSPLSAPFQPYGGSPVAVGVTAPALVSAIAMRRGQPAGPTTDQEIEDFLYDALDLMPGANDVEVRCDGGRISLTGAVSQKRLKRDIGEIAWAIPAITDVQNTVTIAPRRRTRTAPGRETEAAAVAGRKTA
jgi:hypothetical protein